MLIKPYYVVGFSGGVTSAWCAAWALKTYPKDQVVLLWHDTKEEDDDTLRFLHEFAAKLDHPITERSDGRSVEQIEDDEGMLANDRVAFCSRILKAEQRQKYFNELRHQAFFNAQPLPEITLFFGYTADEWKRIQKATMEAAASGYTVRFPLAEQRVDKQEAADFIQCTFNIELPRMYTWSGHANCVGCRRGSKGYWWAVKQNAPEVFVRKSQREHEFGHSYLTDTFLDQLTQPRAYKNRESIEVGTCECGS